MTGTLAAVVTLGLMVVIAIDHPFRGAGSVDPEPILAVLGGFRGR